MTKKSAIALFACVATFAALLAIATFFDLQISIAIGNADSVFGQFFNYLGETPAWLGLPAACLIIYQAIRKEHKFYKWLKPIALAITFVGFFLFARYLMDEMFIELKWSYLYMVVFGAVMTFLAVVATNRVDKAIFEKLMIFAVLVLVCLAVSQGLVTILKYLWSRQRFRNLQVGNVVGGTSTGFTPWYMPALGKHDPGALYADLSGGKEYSGAYKSFPSGHTAAAGISFAVIIIPEIFEKAKKYKIWFYVLPAIYTVLVAVSRIVNRAHYLSDVLFGGTISVTSVFVFKYVLKKIWLKYNLVGANSFREINEVSLEADSTIVCVAESSDLITNTSDVE